MEIAKACRKKINRNVGHLDLDESNQYLSSKSIEEKEQMLKEMEHQMLQFERNITEKKLNHDKTSSRLRYGWICNEHNFRIDCSKKMELDKLTFANNAYRNKKAVISFSSGEREINIHNLNHRMLHEARSMDGEKRLLKMLNPTKDTDFESSLQQIEEQMLRLFNSMRWPLYDNSTSTVDVENIKRKLKELQCEKDQVFVNAPSKASLWNALPSTKDLRNQIHEMEARDEEKRKMVLEKRKKRESKEKEMKKTENEIKYMRKMMERIRIRRQRTLDIISHEKDLLKQKLYSLGIE